MLKLMAWTGVVCLFLYDLHLALELHSDWWFRFIGYLIKGE
jgi:hypothetical protein